MSRLHRPFGHDHPHPQPGPCCWVATGNLADGPMCRTHEHAVAEAVVRDSAAVNRPGVDLFGLLPGPSDIDTDRPDSDAPGPIEEPRSNQ